MCILLVEHDTITARGTAQVLKDTGGVIDHAYTGEDALERVRHHDYDIIILALRLPDIEGFEVIRCLRAARNDTPVLILSDLNRAAAKAKALSLGADDFITKPFNPAELLARIQAIVRRGKGRNQFILDIGPLRLNTQMRDVAVKGRVVPLTGKEYDILEALVVRKGVVLTKEVLLNQLYAGRDEPEMKIIDVFVCKLRKKLAEAGVHNMISTAWGRGYAIHEPDAACHVEPSRTTIPQGVPAWFETDRLSVD
jgi:two-component system, cell cycle response regulator CtrA